VDWTVQERCVLRIKSVQHRSAANNSISMPETYRIKDDVVYIFVFAFT
jgi:hypothetical protein